MAREDLSTARSVGTTLAFFIPRTIRDDSAYKDVDIKPDDPIKIEIYGSSLRITKIDENPENEKKEVVKTTA